MSGVNLTGHLRKFVPYHLVIDKIFPECFPLQGVFERVLETDTCKAVGLKRRLGPEFVSC